MHAERGHTRAGAGADMGAVSYGIEVNGPEGAEVREVAIYVLSS